MKKLLSYVMFVILIFSTVGCKGSIRKIIDFAADDVYSVEIYDAPVPASAKRKIVNKAEDINAIINTLAAVKIKGKGESADLVVGGSIQFVFNKFDGEKYIISYDGATIESSNGDWYEVSSKNSISGLWSKMKYIEKSVAENELPFYTKKKSE